MGNHLTIKVELPGREVAARVWQVNVGRVKLYLLDANLPENTQIDQQLTEKLYGSDLELRISQEILLGMGGVKLLHALNINPTAWHMNEGHSAFLEIERLREYIAEWDEPGGCPENCQAEQYFYDPYPGSGRQ